MKLLGLTITSRKAEEMQALRTTVSELEGTIDRVKAISLNDPVLARIFAGTYDVEKDELGPLRNPYSQLPTVYACIRARSINLAQVPFLLFPRGSENQITTGPMFDLFMNPNEQLSRFSLWEGSVTSLDTSGNGYIVKDAEEVRGVPANLFLFPHSWIKPARTKGIGTWVGWWLKRPGEEKEFLEKERVIHIKNYNPGNSLLGLSPLSVARVTNEQDWDAARYNRNFFTNDATPSLAYIAQGRLNPRQKTAISKDLIEDNRGVTKSHNGVLLEGGMDVKNIGISQKDMEYLAGRKFSREEISMIYKVPKAEIELYEDMNYATATSADRSFWKKTLIPLGRMIQEEVNRKFLHFYGMEGRFDFMAIDALNAELLEKAEAADKYVKMGYPLNVVNTRLNLGFPDVAHGDEPMVFAPSPLGLAAPEETEKLIQMESVKAEELAKAARGKRWTELTQKLLPLIGRASSDVRKYFYDVTQKILRSILKSVTAIEEKDRERIRKLMDFTSYIPEVDKAATDFELDTEAEIREAQVARRAWRLLSKQFEELPEDEILAAFSDEELRAALEKHVLAALEAGITSVVGSPLLLQDPAAQEILELKLIKVLEINDTAKAEIIETLRKELLDGLAEGLGEAELSQRIVDRLNGKMKDIQRRARTIARTEIGSTFSMARMDAIKETDPVGIRWISSRDSKVRDTHADLDGETTPAGTAFTTIKGNLIRFPHDPNAAAEEVINCRCTFDPIYEGEV